MFKKVWMFLVVTLAFAVSYFRGRAISSKAEASRERDRADSAETSAALSHRVDENVSEVERKQREEQIDAQSNFNTGDRDHLDNRW